MSLIINNLYRGGYDTPSCRVLRIDSKNIFCSSLTGTNRQQFGTFVIVDEGDWDDSE